MHMVCTDAQRLCTPCIGMDELTGVLLEVLHQTGGLKINFEGWLVSVCRHGAPLERGASPPHWRGSYRVRVQDLGRLNSSNTSSTDSGPHLHVSNYGLRVDERAVSLRAVGVIVHKLGKRSMFDEVFDWDEKQRRSMTEAELDGVIAAGIRHNAGVVRQRFRDAFPTRGVQGPPLLAQLRERNLRGGRIAHPLARVIHRL